MSTHEAAQLTYAAWGELKKPHQVLVIGAATAAGALARVDEPLYLTWLLALLAGLLLTTSA